MEKQKFLDSNGLSFLWGKIALADYPNNETLIAVINAIDETKANKNFEEWTFTLSDGTEVIKQVNING